MSLWHRLMHLLGNNSGEVTTFWQGQSLMVGFKCHGCGLVSGIHESVLTDCHNPERFGLPAYPTGDVVGPCVCGSWPGGKCLRCKVIRVETTHDH